MYFLLYLNAFKVCKYIKRVAIHVYWTHLCSDFTWTPLCI